MKNLKKTHALSAILAMLLISCALPEKVFATTYNVTSAADPSVTASVTGTLRDAINSVNSGSYSAISFSIGSPYTITLIDELPDIIKPVTINGNISGTDVTIQGNIQGSVFNKATAFGCFVFSGSGFQGSTVENMEFKYFNTAIYVVNNNNSSSPCITISGNTFYNNDLDIELETNNCFVRSNTFYKDATDVSVQQGLTEIMSGIFIHRQANVPLNTTNTIGGAGYSNAFSNVQGGAVIVENANENLISENTFTQSADPCASTSACLPSIVLNGDVFTTTGNNNVASPTILSNSSGTITGSVPLTSGKVEIYSSTCCQCTNSFLGTATISSGGTWAIAGTGVSSGAEITALAIDANNNTSPLSYYYCNPTAKPLVIDSSGGCGGSGVILCVPGYCKGCSYQWYKGSMPVGSGANSYTTAGPSPYTVTVTTFGGGCIKNSDTITIY